MAWKRSRTGTGFKLFVLVFVIGANTSSKEKTFVIWLNVSRAWRNQLYLFFAWHQLHVSGSWHQLFVSHPGHHFRVSRAWHQFHVSRAWHQLCKGFLENYRIFRDLEGFLRFWWTFLRFFVHLFQKSLKLGNVSLQAILKPLMPPHSIGQRFYP